MRRVGIVGAGGEKFSALGAERAKALIAEILGDDGICVSGHSPMGGVDVWAEEYVEGKQGRAVIFHPAMNRWEGGYKQRNLEIARYAEEMHVIVVDSYPVGYRGRKFDMCWHCVQAGRKGENHVKSGGCATANMFEKSHLGQKANIHVVLNT